MTRTCIVLAVVALLAPPGTALAEETLSPPSWADIWPIFRERCVNCHSEHGAPNGVRLDSYEAVIEGGANGPVVFPGNAAESPLVKRLLGLTTPRMPFLSTRLPDDQIDLILRWVDGGLP